MKSKPNRIANFQGVICPYNYVKTKLILEEMPLGQILEVIVDEGEPSHHVPKSLLQDGQAILEKFADSDGLIHILVQKNTEY